MKLIRPIKKYFTVIARYRYQWLVFIAVSWTLIDVFFMDKVYAVAAGGKV